MDSLRELLKKTWPAREHTEELIWGCTIYDNSMRIVFGECIDLSPQERKLLLYTCVLRQYYQEWPPEPSVELLELRERLIKDLGGEEGVYKQFEYLMSLMAGYTSPYPDDRTRELDEVLEDASSLQTIGSTGLNRLLQDPFYTEERLVKHIRNTLLSVPACLYTETAYKLGISGLQPLLDYIEGKKLN